MHRRRTSSEANAPELTLSQSSPPVAFPDGSTSHKPAHPYAVPPPPPAVSQRLRVHSTPAPYDVRQPQLPAQQLDTSIGPYSGRAPPRSASVIAAPPYRATSFPAVSPASPSFRSPFNGQQLGPSALTASGSLPEGDLLSPISPAFAAPPPTTNGAGRRHTRIHSRNLSVFFPRPGQAPPASIAEDGAQEIEVGTQAEAPVTLIPAPHRTAASPRNSSPQTNVFAPGFKFGARSSTERDQQESSTSSPTTQLSPSTTTARRGHHHKHSLSHNFFPFMDPTATNAAPQIRTTLGDASPSLAMPSTPHSPWQPMSPFPLGSDFSPAVRTRVDSSATPAGVLSLHVPPPIPGHSLVTGMVFVSAYAALEFIAGASLWVIGQQNGSLSCTGLGYWVVFDAMGVMLGAGADAGLFRWLLGDPNGHGLQRPYGHERIETTGLFAQTIYLLFAAVYICKETVEHFLLSFGDSHHHHAFDEYSLETTPFPTTLVVVCLAFIVGTTRLYSNHARLVNATGGTVPVPSLETVKRLVSRTPMVLSSESGTTRSIANPFFLAPTVFATAIVSSSIFISTERHRALDLLLAALETVITFHVAYPAAVALGKVLLQTAPDRGTADGRMESFLRVMRELERHPQVVHLPPPHIWQLTPPSKLGLASAPAQLVVALELHVRKELSDADALTLTREAWERCYAALNPRGSPAGAWGDRTGGGITVGIARES